MAKLGDERVALIAEYARNYDPDRRRRRKLAAKALDLEAGARRSRRSTTSASRRRCRRARRCASCRSSTAAVAHRPADLAPRFRLPSETETTMNDAEPLEGLPPCSCGGGRVARRRPCPAAIGQSRRGNVHRRRQQDRPRAARQRQVSEIPLDDAVAVEFSPRKPRRRRRRPDSRRARARGRSASASADSRDRPGRHGDQRPPDAGDRRRYLAGRADVQGDRRRSGDDRRHRSSSRAARRPSLQAVQVQQSGTMKGSDKITLKLNADRLWRHGVRGRDRLRRSEGQG